MKIALAQLNYHLGNFEKNAEKIIRHIKKAKEDSADLIVFSELSVCGYSPYDLLEKSNFIDQVYDSVKRIASVCQGISVIIGAPTINESQNGKKLHNSAIFIKDCEITDTVHKTLLPTYDIFDEYRYFEPNTEFRVIDVNGKKIAITICEDLWDDQPTSNSFAKSKLYITSPIDELEKLNPDIVINIAGSPFSYNQKSLRKDILVKNAKEHHVPVVYVNQVGAQAELIFDGGSMYVDNEGKIIDELAYFKEDYRLIDTEFNEVESVQPEQSAIEKIHDALVLGIRDYFLKMNFSKAVIGLSGGIDSAIVAALAVEALGKENVHGLLMPSKYSSGHSVDDAVALAKNLGIKYDLINIQSVVDSFEKSLSPLFENLNPDVTEENIQARARGIFLMALSNKYRYILLNTSNKSECAVGYGTLYGDMNGGLSVLGDVYKSDCYKLAGYINRDKEVIPQNTIIKPPSAELRPGQKDSDSLPEYDILDKILFRYIELNQSAEDIIRDGFDEMIVRKAVKLVNINEYKRFQAPPILRVSSKAFGFGRRIPLVAKFDI
ncbi:MAG: NAD+ synthase [Prolixibacteraceae bacterium]|nr:NAD+ synthase [Prolixibacteraceae bacterium]